MDTQRQAQRLTLNKDFESFDDFVNEYVLNISRTGAFIRCDDPPEVGTKINLKFNVFFDGIQTIEGRGKVVRVESSPPGVGVVFTELTKLSEQVMKQILTRNV